MNSHQYFLSSVEIMDILHKKGHEAYIVGGAVRDFVMGRELHDIDIATSASVEEVCFIFPKTIKVAIHHGTVIVRHNRMSFEVTAFRGDTLLEDLAKRDFTMNAMAMSSQGEIIDPFQGQIDIEEEKICTVGDPIERFQEDPLRMLRLFRFMSELGFSINHDIIQLIQGERALVSTISIERIMNELEKLFKGNYVNLALHSLFETRLIDLRTELRPLLRLQNLLAEGMVISNVKSLSEIWALVLHQYDIVDIDQILRTWKQSKKVISEVAVMVNALPSILRDGWSFRALYRLGKDTAYKIEWVKSTMLGDVFSNEQVNCLYEKLPIKSTKDLAINGKQVGKLIGTNKDGKKIGRLMSLVELAVVDGVVMNQTEALIDWLRNEELKDEE